MKTPFWRRRTVLLTLSAIIVLGVLVYQAARSSFNWKLFLNTIEHVSWGWLVTAIFLTLLTLIGRAVRWEVMLRPLGGNVGLVRLTSDTAIGFMAATLLGRVGEFVRPYLISVSAGVSFSSQIAAWVLERLLDLLAILLIFGFGLTIVPNHNLRLGAGLRWTLSVGGYLAAVAGIASVLLLVAFRNFSGASRERILAALAFLPDNSRLRAKTFFDSFARGLEATKDQRSLVLLILYTGLEWAIIMGSYLALFRSFPETKAFTAAEVVTILGFVSFGSVVQIPGIGGGVQVTAIVVLKEIFGLSLEASSGIALFLWILTLVVVVPAGAACALSRGFDWRKIKEIAAHQVPQQGLS